MTHFINPNTSDLTPFCGSSDRMLTNGVGLVDCPECLVRIAEATCTRCGVLVRVGDWYQCPHPRGSNAVIGDEIPGGETCENYGRHPVTFYSESERRDYLTAHGLQRAERFCPTPGTDIDPAGVKNPKGYMDPYTLENARILSTRVKGYTEPLPEIQRPFTLIDGGKDAEALVGGNTKRSSRVGRRIAHAGSNTVDTGREHPAQKS